MIKANELRIGNLVIVNNPKYRPDITGNVCVISGIDSNRPSNHFKSGTSVSLYVQNDEYKDIIGQWIEFLEPIPLTEEWLIRFGFELEEDFLYCLNGFYVLVKGNEFRFTPYGCLLDTNPDFESFNKVEFVHELQNTYYWNNNKTELELK